MATTQFVIDEKSIKFKILDGTTVSQAITAMQLVSYYRNDMLPDLVFYFLDANGIAYSLATVSNVRFKLRLQGAAVNIIDSLVTMDSDPALGKASYVFSSTDLATAGKYTGEVALEYGAPVAATSGTDPIVLTGISTANANVDVVFSVGGTVTVLINNGDTADVAATTIMNAINGSATAPVTAALDTLNPNWVRLTAKTAGVGGNAVTYHVDPLTMPAGQTATPNAAMNLTGGLSPTIKSRTIGQFQLTVLEDL